MDYPNSFETPAFPAGKRIAVSRVFSVGVEMLFFLIICVCGLLMWVRGGATVEPFIISIDSVTGAWSIVGHPHGQMAYSATRTMQESVIANFTRDWFTIGASAENDALWKTCERESQCMSDNAPARIDKTCAIYCASGDEVFNSFILDVVPTWVDIADASGRMTVDTASIQISPIGQISTNGGMWTVRANLSTSFGDDMQIIAFAKVARRTSVYPRTLGYYIVDFNAYRLN